MIPNAGSNVEESHEMINMAGDGGGIGSDPSVCASVEGKDNSTSRFRDRSETWVMKYVRREVINPVRHSAVTREFSLLAVTLHEPTQSPPTPPTEKLIDIESLDDVFSSTLFASGEQKKKLLDIAKRKDINDDKKLSRDEYDELKKDLKKDHPDLYKIFVAIPERYTSVPVFILSTALLILCVKVFHFIHYNIHHSNDWNKVYPSCSHLIYDVDRKVELWRMITYTYAHADLGHCTLNIAILLIVGVPLEMVHGAARVAVIWFIGSIGGAAGFALLGMGC